MNEICNVCFHEDMGTGRIETISMVTRHIGSHVILMGTAHPTHRIFHGIFDRTNST